MSSPSPTHPRDSAFKRHAVLAAVVLAIYLLFMGHPPLMVLLGVDHLGVWFMDTRAVLAASDANALGIARSVPNPLDLLRQPHVYSDWWFELHHLGLDRHDHVWVGALMGFGFLAGAIAQLGARSWREVACGVGVLVSPPVLLGFNRGNVDLLIFLLLSLAPPALASRSSAAKFLGVGVIVIAAGLKFFPAAALILVLAIDENRGLRWLLLLFGTAALAGVAIDQAESLRHYAADTQVPFGFFTFGAAIAPQLLGLPLGLGVAVASLFLAAAAGIGWRQLPAAEPGPTVNDLRFLLGAVLVIACYLTTINFAYRLVFLLWTLPTLLDGSNATSPTVRLLCRLAVALVLILLWADGLACFVLNMGAANTADDVDRWLHVVVLAQQPLALALAGALLLLALPRLRDGFKALFRSTAKP